MNNFTRDDQHGRLKFKTEFSNYYLINDTDEYDSTDMLMTGITNNSTYNVELKRRYIDIHKYSGSTIIEEIKVQAMKKKYQEDPERKIVYFNYYYDSNWIAFDITNRIKYNEWPELKNDIYPASTSVDRGDKCKQVRYLSFTNNEKIKDKIMVRNLTF